MEKNHKQIVFLISQAPMNFNFFNREQNNVNSNNNTNKKKKAPNNGTNDSSIKAKKIKDN